MIRENLIEILHEMEEVTKLFKLEPFEIYIIGLRGSLVPELCSHIRLGPWNYLGIN